jgi:hypothetical protein
MSSYEVPGGHDSALLVAASPVVHSGVGFGAHVGGTLCGAGLIALEKLRLRNQPAVVSQPVQPAAIYLFLNDAQSGPFTLGQVRQMLSLGSISSETLYWKEGLDDWRAVDELRAPRGA